MFLDLLSNIAILAAFLFIWGQLFTHHPMDRDIPLRTRIILGLCFGIMGILLMVYSIDVTPTIIVDLRNVATLCAGVIGGPITVMITSVIIAAFRLLYYGIHSASIVAAIVAIALGIGCSFIARMSLSRLNKFIYMMIYALVISMAAFRYLISDMNKLLDIFSFYIPITLIGVILAYFALEYIISRQIIEQKLKKSNEEIIDILESIQDAFFTIDQDWKFTYVNKKFINIITSYDEKLYNLLGRYTWEVFAKDLYSHFYTEFQKAMEKKTPVSFIGYSLVTNRWYDVNVYPKNDGISVYFRDITANRRLEESLRESEERFRTAFENAAMGMTLVTIEGRFIRANQPYCSMLGYTEEELKRITFYELTHPDDLEENNKVIQQLLEGNINSFHIEKRLLHKEGYYLWVQVNSSVLRDGQGAPLYYIAQVQDITDRIRAAEELQQINNQLIEQRAEAERQREEAIEANKHKSQFLATMSHELRTPLNSIIGFTNRVIKKCAEILPMTQLENLAIVRDEAHHLLELINSLLDYSKIEAGKMEVYAEEFDLKHIIDEVLTMTISMAESKHLKFQKNLIATEDILIYSDKLKVKQVLINLLSNAFKYSDKGTVTLSVNMSENMYRIEVRDEGIGISEEHIERIFDEFLQVDGTYTRKVGGTGLGLSITKRFVDMLGGSIKVKSILGKGSQFIVLLPIRYSE